MRNVSQKEIATPDKSYAKESKLKITTKQITYIATLTAVTLLLKIIGNMLIIEGSLKISFTYIGWALAGIILGPFGGAVVGLCTDTLGMIIFPAAGGINPVLTLGYTLFPFFVGLSYKYLPIKNKNISITLGFIASTVICTLGICSAGLYFYYGYNSSMSFMTYVLTTRLLQVPMAGANLVIVLLLYPVVKRMNLINNK